MALTYIEAYLFLRAGDDLRRTVFPANDFVRWIDGPIAPEIPGYTSELYAPTTNDLTASDWRRA